MNRIFQLALVAMLVGSTMFARSNPTPLINAPLVPESAAPGSGGFTLTVNGTGFVAGATVQWNGSPRSTEVISSSQLQAAISAADIADATMAAVTVRNPGARGGSSNLVYFPVRTSSSTLTVALHGGVSRIGPLAAGDFNGDGKMDIAVAAEGHNREYVNMYPGNGDGTFGTRIQTLARHDGPLCCYIFSTLVGDLNGDGNLDLALNETDGDGSDPTFGYVLLGNGDGTFRETHGLQTYIYNAVAFGDLTGDGLVDLITTGAIPAYPEPETNIYLTDLSSNLTLSQTFTDVGGAGAAVGDFNGDGKLDLALAGTPYPEGGNGVWVALGNGDGTFQTPVRYSTTNPSTNIFAADLNGDGKLDLVTDGICTLYGNGDGTFTQGSCLGTGYNSVTSMALADFNGDGKLDVLLFGGFSEAVSVYLGNGDGTFENPMSYTPPRCEYPCSLATADFNNDGRFDFALTLQPGTGVFLQSSTAAAAGSADQHDQIRSLSKP